MSAYTHPGSERVTTSDWFTSNYAVSTDCERGCIASHDVRQEARYLRNETDNKTYWDQVSETPKKRFFVMSYKVGLRQEGKTGGGLRNCMWFGDKCSHL